jgi:hypothetical protein
MMNPYYLSMLAYQRARGGIMPSGFPRVPMGAPAGTITGYAPNPAYRQAQFQAPWQQGMGIVGQGALTQAELNQIRTSACALRTSNLLLGWGGPPQPVNAPPSTDAQNIGALVGVVLFSGNVTKMQAARNYVASHLDEWCPTGALPFG